MRADNSRHLTTAARQRAEQTRARAVRALRRLDETGKSITFEAVAAEAGVSRSWLYSQQDIRAEIQALRTRRQPSPAAPLTPQRQRATEASLLRSLEATSQRMRHLEEDNRQLRQALAEALGSARTAQTTGKDEPTRPSGERPLPAHHDAVVLALGGGQQQGRVDDTVHKTNTQVNPLTGPTPEDNVGFVRGEQRLAGAGRDRVQPHPRRRLPGLGLPRQSHHRHHPRPADQHPGSAGPLRPPPPDAPSAALAVGAGLVPAVPGHPGTTPTGLTRPPADRPNRNRSGKAGQTGPAGTPTPGVKIRTPSQTRSNFAWCIQDQPFIRPQFDRQFVSGHGLV